jgi:predicted nucleotidyltransferase
MLSYLITSNTKRQILTFFIVHPDERFYHFDLARRLELPSSAVHTELKKLEKIGFLESERVANIVFYWLNKDFALYHELKGIVLKTMGVAAEIQNNLEKIGSIDFAFIYGSVAKNQEDAKSDIDLMVIGDPDMDALYNAVTKAERSLSREVNLSTFDLREWQENIRNKRAYPFDVYSGKKIFIIGNEEKLKQIVEQ